jgi:RNA recognition motif-containing protein
LPLEEALMATKLFVGNLPYDTQEEELKELFARFGTAQSIKVIKDKYTGRSRGFAFVEMTSPDEAQRAIQDLNGHRIGERAIVVNEAKNQEPGPPRRDRDFGGRRGGGPRTSGGLRY